MRGSIRSFGWIVALAAVWACSETERDSEAGLARPSGLVVLKRTPLFTTTATLARADVLVADSEADGVRVLQLADSQRPRFLFGPLLFQPLLITAPGYPTEVSAVGGSNVPVAVAFAPGQGALHFLWVPEVRFGATSQFQDGQVRLASLALASEGLVDPLSSLDAPVATVSILGTPEIRDRVEGALPAAAVVVDQQTVSGAEPPQYRQRLMVAYDPLTGPDGPTRLVVVDVSVGLPASSSDPVRTATAASTSRGRIAVEGLVDTATVAPGLRRFVRLFDGSWIATSVASGSGRSGLTQLRVPSFEENHSIQISRIAVGGPVPSVVPITDTDQPGFLALRSDAPLVEVFRCPPDQSCVRVDAELSSPFGSAEEPGILRLRESPVVAGAFADDAPLVVQQSGQGAATLHDPDAAGGVTHLVHRDAVATFVVGPVDGLQVATTRTATFAFPDGQVGREPLPLLEALFARTEGAVGSTIDGCDFGPSLSCPAVPRPPPACADLRLRELPVDALYRASFRGELASGFEAERLIQQDDRCSDGSGPCRYRLEFGSAAALGTDLARRLYRAEIEPDPGAGAGPIDRVDLYLTCTTDPPVNSDPQDLEIAFDGGASLRLHRVEGRSFEALGETEPDVRVRGTLSTSPTPPGSTVPPALTDCDPDTLELFAYRIYPAGSEAVLTLESPEDGVLEVLQRAPATEQARFDTEGLAFTWRSAAGPFACDLPSERPTGLAGEFPVTGSPCESTDTCGPGRSCIFGDGGDAAVDCPGACPVRCQSATRCFIGLQPRVCPEIEIRANGAGPVALDLRRRPRAGSTELIAIVPEQTVYVPARRAFLTSFPGARSLREVRLTDSGIFESVID